jgi:transposase-like protein
MHLGVSIPVSDIGSGPTAVRDYAAYAVFERAWAKRCPGVVTSLREGGDELFTFFTYVIERLHEEFRRRVKTQGSLPSEDAALILSGQIRLRRIDGWRKIASVLCQHTSVAA